MTMPKIAVMKMVKMLPVVLSVVGVAAVAQAPIERAAPSQPPAMIQTMPPRYAAPKVNSMEPIPGVWVRSTDAVTKVSADANGVEVRVDKGRATVDVHQPAPNVQILIDLPGGQVALLKDGVYTFNGQTSTVRVLQGEAEGFAGKGEKGLKVKEYQQLVLGAPAERATDVGPGQLQADLLPNTANPARNYGTEYGFRPYVYGEFYGYPYYASEWGWPGYGWGYPYGFYDGFYGGFGFGYYGGFGGGYRGFGGGRGFRR